MFSDLQLRGINLAFKMVRTMYQLAVDKFNSLDLFLKA